MEEYLYRKAMDEVFGRKYNREVERRQKSHERATTDRERNALQPLLKPRSDMGNKEYVRVLEDMYSPLWRIDRALEGYLVEMQRVVETIRDFHHSNWNNLFELTIPVMVENFLSDEKMEFMLENKKIAQDRANKRSIKKKERKKKAKEGARKRKVGRIKKLKAQGIYVSSEATPAAMAEEKGEEEEEDGMELLLMRSTSSDQLLPEDKEGEGKERGGGEEEEDGLGFFGDGFGEEEDGMERLMKEFNLKLKEPKGKAKPKTPKK